MILILISFSGWIFSISSSLPQMLLFLSRISLAKEIGLSSVTWHLFKFFVSHNTILYRCEPTWKPRCLRRRRSMRWDTVQQSSIGQRLTLWLSLFFFKSFLQFLLLLSLQVYGFLIPNINLVLAAFSFGTLCIGPRKCLGRSTPYFEQPWTTTFTFCRLALQQQETTLFLIIDFTCNMNSM